MSQQGQGAGEEGETHRRAMTVPVPLEGGDFHEKMHVHFHEKRET